MSFDPILPGGGLLGYRLLIRTEETQRDLFEKSPEIARDIEYFTENIASVTTAEELVSDRRLLRVALGAFGLDDEVDKAAYLRKVLEEGTEDSEAFANRIVDPRYAEFAETFGFGNLLGARTGDVGFAGQITSAYKERQFEIAVGDQDETLRIALNFRREIKEYAESSDPEGTAWLSILGDEPVAEVFKTAFGLTSEFSGLDIDRQREELKSFNDRFFGSKSVAIFSDDAEVDKLIDRYLLRSEINNGPSANTRGFTALSILNASQSGVGAVGIESIVIGASSGSSFF